MMITISKEEFEKYVLAATSARCETYDQVSKQFENEYNYHVSFMGYTDIHKTLIKKLLNCLIIFATSKRG